MRVTITFDGLETVLNNLSSIENKAPRNVQKQTDELGRATLSAWQQGTPQRSGRLRNADVMEPGSLSFVLKNATRYYGWVNDGHMTPAGWRTKRGYRPAKRRSHVQGREMTQKAVQFVEQNIEHYLSKFLDNV